MMNMTAKKICALAMLSAIAFLLAAFVRVPVVLFLRYDPKDIVITLGGFLFGPIAAFIVTVVVSFIQMITVSGTGYFGLIMNIVSSASFCCTAAYIYQKNRSLKGAVIGLLVAIIVSTAVMMAWNYLIAPIFMGQPREVIAGLLISAFLPFNLLSGILNAAFTMLLYKHVKRALQSARLLPQATEKGRGISPGIVIASIFIIITCVLWIMMLQGLLTANA